MTADDASFEAVFELFLSLYEKADEGDGNIDLKSLDDPLTVMEEMKKKDEKEEKGPFLGSETDINYAQALNLYTELKKKQARQQAAKERTEKMRIEIEQSENKTAEINRQLHEMLDRT
jgi:hypothetical protein